MQLFSRRVHMTGPPAEAMAYAVEMRAHVSGLAGREISLWSVGFGAPLGTMIYSARVEGLADLQSITTPILADAEYHAKLAKGAAYASGPAEDSLLQPINGEIGDPPPVGSLAVLTSAVVANGAYEAAIGWGIDMAEHVTAVSGMPTLFLSQQYGPFGAVGWIGVAADGSAVDAANAAINADAAYLAKLGAVGDLFVEGSGHRMLATRVA